MPSTHRPYDPGQNDFDRLWRFLQQDYADRGDGFTWLVSRLGDWQWGLWNPKKQQPNFFSEHAHLWQEACGRLLGFVLSEDGQSTLFIFTRLGQDELWGEILEWALENWGPRYGGLTVEVSECQAEAGRQLRLRGFQPSGVVATTRQFDLREKKGEPVVLQPGFRIVDMVENGDYTAKAALNLEAFGGVLKVSAADLRLFAASRRNPVYDPRFDLSVVSAAGQHVASCVGFFDPANGACEVEKVCTHSHYRRLGLAEAAIRTCFHRLDGAGIRVAHITSYGPEADNLYEKLGPVKRWQWLHYEWQA